MILANDNLDEHLMLLIHIPEMILLQRTVQYLDAQFPECFNCGDILPWKSLIYGID